MRSLILALAVAAMAVSSGCSCLSSNGSGCGAGDGCPGGLMGRSGMFSNCRFLGGAQGGLGGGCRLGNCRLRGGGGEGGCRLGSHFSGDGGGCGCRLGRARRSGGRRGGAVGLGAFETGSECSSCDSCGDSCGGGCDGGSYNGGGGQTGLVSNFRDRRQARVANRMSDGSEFACAPPEMVEGPVMYDGPATGGCGLGSCGMGGRGCGQGCGLGGRLAGQAAARTAQHDPYGGQIPHTNPALGPQGGGGPAPTYRYPYYTTRGPRDFLNGNPPSIGPR